MNQTESREIDYEYSPKEVAASYLGVEVSDADAEIVCNTYNFQLHAHNENLGDTVSDRRSAILKKLADGESATGTRDLCILIKSNHQLVSDLTMKEVRDNLRLNIALHHTHICSSTAGLSSDLIPQAEKLERNRLLSAYFMLQKAVTAISPVPEVVC